MDTAPRTGLPRLHFEPRETEPRPWSPMTEEEWYGVMRHIGYMRVARRTGRPPRDPRATWNGIFWIACSTLPWAAMPPEFGRPDTANSALLWAARRRWLDTMLLAVSRHPFADPAMETLEWRVCRAFRRATRQLTLDSLMLARDLGMSSAIYCAAEAIPRLTPLALAPPDAAPRLPRLPRRVLRGLPPNRHTPMEPPALPPQPALAQPRRDSQARPRPVRRTRRC